MNRIISTTYVLIFVMAVVSCASQKKAVGDTSEVNTENVDERNGTSMEKAVIAESIDAEYDWVRRYYPGSRVTGQALVNKGKKYYDVLTVKLANGSERKVYFDINSFFGKDL